MVRLLHRATPNLLVLITLPIFASVLAFSQPLTVLHTFGGSDGEFPFCTLLRDSAGNLYGTTAFGAAGYGTIFKLDTTGNYTVLHTFLGSPNDGAYPEAGLLWDRRGHLYGTTAQGGTTNGGTIFLLAASGKETVLHNFTLNGTDGQWPYAGLVQDAAGILYGTTSVGGRYGGGIVFAFASTGKEKALFNLDGNGGGAMWPGGGNLVGGDGGVVGTTSFGGSSNLGTVYSLNASGEHIVVNFSGVEGEFPYAGLIKDSTGNFYGTTQFGGDLTCHAPSSGCGVVFKLDATGDETVLYSFLGSPDGDDPVAQLVLDKDGNLYGVTKYGGTGECQNEADGGCGTIFKISPTGSETVLHSFTGGADGAYPEGGLILDAEGNLYGTTTNGGSSACNGNGCGTIFKFTP